MGSKSIALLLALACAIALGFFFFGSGPDRGDHAIARGAGADVVVPKAAQDVSLGDAAPLLDTGPAPIASRATLEAGPVAVDPVAHPWADMLAGLTGRVIERDGTPVVGMPVELLEGDANLLFEADDTPLGRPEVSVGEALTDSEGRFTIEGAGATAFHVLALDSGGGRASIRFVEQSLEYGTLTDMGDIVLPGFGTVIGTVIDEDGEPVPGARVRLAPVPEPVLQSGVLDLREGCLLAFDQGGMVQTIDFPYWAMSLLDRLPISTTMTASDGTFRLEGVPLTTVAGGIDKAGFVATTIVPFEMKEGEHDLDEIDLEVGRTITGRVIDKLGKAVAGAEVRAGALHPIFKVGFLQPMTGASTTTDEDGHFEVPGIGDLGQVVATARRVAGDTWVSAKAGGGSPRVDVILPAAAPITVHVRDAAGEPLEGAKVTVRPKPASQGMFSMGIVGMLGIRGTRDSFQITETEPGVHVVSNLSLGNWIVRAEVEGHAKAEAEVEHLTEKTTCDLVCNEGRTVTVLVVDAATSEAVPSAHVRVIGPTENLFGAIDAKFTDDVGLAKLGPIAAKGEESTASSNIFGMGFDLHLVVEHPRYGMYDIEVPASDEMITVPLTPACELNGRITWAGSSPSEVYMVALVRDDKGNSEVSMAFSTPRTALTNLEGSFRFTALSEGKYDIHVLRRFLDVDPFEFMIEQKEPELIYRAEVEIVVGEENVVVIELEADGEGPTATFAGRVTVEGEPVVGGKVSINGKTDQELTTNVFGEFESEPVAAIGRYRIRISGEVLQPDGSTAERELFSERIRPEAGTVHRIDVAIDYEMVVVEVVDASTGDFVEGVLVRAGGGGGGRFGGRSLDVIATIEDGGESRTGNDGRVEVMTEKAGSQRVTATVEGYSDFSANVNIDPNAPIPQVRIELHRTVPCAGRVVLPAHMAGSTESVHLMISNKGSGGSEWVEIGPGEITFDVSGLSEGEYTAMIWGNGSRTTNVEFELGPGGDVNLVLNFDTGD